MVAKTEDFIRKNIAGQKTKQAQSRRKMLDKLDRIDRPEDVWATAERVAFRFAPAARTGDIVIDAKGLGAERGGRVLFSDFDVLVRRGERIGVVGPNGTGKSTLLKLLAGRGGPEDPGVVRRGTNLQEGYFDQHLGDVEPRLTAVDNVRRVRGDFTVEAARQYLARFRFWGDDPLRVVSGFSGGERSRLALAKLLLEPKNLLFLDEPTNHLDIPASEILEEALDRLRGDRHPRLARSPLPRERDDTDRARARGSRRGLPGWIQGLREGVAEGNERQGRYRRRCGPRGRGVAGASGPRITRSHRAAVEVRRRSEAEVRRKAADRRHDREKEAPGSRARGRHRSG